MTRTTAKPVSAQPAARWLSILSTTGLIRSRPSCGLGRVNSSKSWTAASSTPASPAAYAPSGRQCSNSGRFRPPPRQSEVDADWDPRAGPALHGAQAQGPAGARPQAPARGDHRRLQRHHLRNDLRRSRRAARPLSANGGSSTAPSPTVWRKPASACALSTACRGASGGAPA
jgi:hypothetical protein